MLTEMRKQIDKSLEVFLDRAHKTYKLDLVNPILSTSIKEFCLRKGKRIRPILLAIAYKGYRVSTKPMSPSIYYAATCIELLHNFMLIHDDIIDRSSLRRGKPTLHILLRRAIKTREQDKLGADLSIVAGDIVYALAIDAFLSINENLVRKERALKYFIQTAVFTAMGEFVDTLHGVQSLDEVKEKDVFLNYTLKTARYTFDCPLVVGAILAGASNKDIRKLSQVGLLIGQAFQIQDDIIGVFDTQKNIGKSILSDIAESKKTLLVCHAYRALDRATKKKFVSCFTKTKKSYADLITIRKFFLQAGSLHYSLHKIKSHLQRSRRIIASLGIKPTYRKLLLKSLFELFQHSEQVASRYGLNIPVSTE